MPHVVRWPGHIKPGTIKTEMFVSQDWLPTFVDIAGGAKGNDLKAQIEKGAYPGIVKTTLDGVNQRAYLEGTSDHSARDYFFYYSGSTPSAVRYKNWKMLYGVTQSGAAGSRPAPTSPSTGRSSPTSSAILSSRVSCWETRRPLANVQGALAGPLTAYVYDWNVLPIGQLLWLKELEFWSREFPPLQAPETYNLSNQAEMRKGMGHPSE